VKASDRMDDYEKDMLEKFQTEGLRRGVINYFGIIEEALNSWERATLDKIVNDLITYNGNLVSVGSIYDNWNNFTFIGLSEVYKKWKT
jgi:hypothetical protein